jgi:hypothetical protein
MKKITFFALLTFLFIDLYISFLQHLSMPLEGDIAGGVVPSKDVLPVFNDPFGFSVISENVIYANPNRFFAHWIFYSYFNIVPNFLQKFVNPIDSVYYSCAIVKILIQIGIAFLIALYVNVNNKFFSIRFLFSLVLIIPFFQTNGYRSYMGIIDPSITYTFFYAFSMVFIFIMYLPIFKHYNSNAEIFKSKYSLLFALFISVVAIFNGPLNSGIILIVNFLLLLNEVLSFKDGKWYLFLKSKSLFYWLFLLITSSLSLYALYIGKNNLIFKMDTIPLFERYLRLPDGLYFIFTQKIGLILLVSCVLINVFLLRYLKANDNTFKLFKWFVVFSVLYVLLLPLGGYKIYRPNIIRYDTFMPITLGLIYFFVQSSIRIISTIKTKKRILYVTMLILISLIYTNADQLELGKNECEKRALNKIAHSTQKIILLEEGCTVLAWEKIRDPKESKLNSLFLKKMGITKDCKFYYQK